MKVRKGARIQRFAGQCNGHSIAEFAFTLPLLAVLLFAIIQYGFIFNAYMTLRHAAHQTARVLSLPLADSSSTNVMSVASQAITPMLDPSNLGAPVVSFGSFGSGNATINVELSYGLPLIIRYVVPNAVSNTLTITAHATYRKESPN